VIALGANLQSTGVQDRMFVRWNAQNNYNDWVATSTNDAGSKRLDVGSRLITAVKSNRQILVLSDKALYVISFVGGSDVYDITLAARAPVIMSPNAIVDVDGVAYFMAEDDFYIFDGTLRILPCDMKNYVFGDAENIGINYDQRSKVSVRLVREFNEIWWSYPEEDQVENSNTIIYNYDRKCWYPASIPREVGGDVTSYYRRPVALYDGKLWIHETGVDAGVGVALPAYLESWEQQFGNGDMLREVVELVPDIKRIQGSFDVTLFGRNYPAEDRVDGPTRTITSTTTKVNPRFKKRQMGIRIESTAVGDDWRIGTWRGKYVPHGRR
jgi:hypothetical protein